MLSGRKYDIVVLDIMMTGMDGWSVASNIRKTSDITIIMLAARGEAYNKLLSFEMGIGDYKVKPITTRELFGLVENIVTDIAVKIGERGFEDPGLMAEMEELSILYPLVIGVYDGSGAAVFKAAGSIQGGIGFIITNSKTPSASFYSLQAGS